MGRYRVCVYAICKNERTFARRWMRSMREADDVVVLDTGSDDGTPALLRHLGAAVTEQRIEPWRFDSARNRSLALVPEDADICVCTDLDEYFAPGWRAKLESAWSPGAGRAQYRYTWNFQPDGSEGCVFWLDKIHARHGFFWKHPVHETLCALPGAPSRTVYAPGVQLNHRADPNKSRAQYLPLLKLAVREDPDDDRNAHYLGREYCFCGEWDKCIETLRRHLAMPQAVWRDERCASMRYLARAHLHKGDRDEARAWLFRAIAEAPHLREPYLDLASMLCEEQDWNGVLYLTGCALRIRERPRSYICEADAWGSLPYDLASLALYYTGRYGEALELVNKAATLAPWDPRLAENKRWMERAAANSIKSEVPVTS